MLALFAAQQAAAATSGLAGGLVPTISASTLDGFAVGMLLSGGVFLLITAHGQGGRRLGRTIAPQPAHEQATEPGGQLGGQELGDYPLPAPAAAALAVATTSAADDRLLVLSHAQELPGPDELPGRAAPEEEPGPAAEHGTSRRPGGYQSRHRLSGSEDSRPWPAPEGRRHAPRHAAPTSSSLARRMSALVPVRMVAASHRAI
jgi:hypothetical protein